MRGVVPELWRRFPNRASLHVTVWLPGGVASGYQLNVASGWKETDGMETGWCQPAGERFLTASNRADRGRAENFDTPTVSVLDPAIFGRMSQETIQQKPGCDRARKILHLSP